MAKDFTVTVHNAERKATFERVLGTSTVCVRSLIPERVNLPGKPATLVYMLDLDQLTAEQWSRLQDHLASKFGLTPEDAASEMLRGVPVLEADCSVVIHSPGRWFDWP